MPCFFSPPQLAKQAGIEPQKICNWISSGELEAVNMAEKLDGRPRWKISEEAWATFLASRSTKKPAGQAAPAAKPRKRAAYKPQFYAGDE